jgi:DNA-binding transcriptional LysR family regulator
MPDRLDAMHAFVAVCDAQGFSSAARRLNLSPSVMTRLVAGLEERLGVCLLHRTTRTVRLTDAGARFLERARRILADVEEAELSAEGERAQPRGRLVVAAPLQFGRLHVAPLVSRFLETYPQVSAELQLSDRVSNLVEDGVDVAIRIGNLADSGLIARRLGQTRRLLVASPAYLANHGSAPRRPSDLVGHRLIAFQAMTPRNEWVFEIPDSKPLSIEVEPHFTTNSGDAAIDLAIAGNGITATFCYQIDVALKSGALVEVLAEYRARTAPIHAVFPTSRLLSGKVRAFLDLAGRVAPSWNFLGAA